MGQIEKVIQDIQELTASSFEEMGSISWTKLQIAAKQFLNILKNLENQSENYNKILLKQLINGDPTSKEFIKGLRGSNQAYIIRTLYISAFKFDEALTKYLNEVPKKAIYVYESPDGKLFSYEMSMEALAKHATADGRIDISLAQLKKENRTALEEQKTLFAEKHVKKAQSAYEGTVHRLNQYFNSKYSNITRDTSEQFQGGVLLWKSHGDWQYGKIINKGDIKEAYLNFLFTEHASSLDYLNNTSTGTPKYYNDELIGNFFENYIKNVTNQAAIVAEDIVTNKMQYSAKSMNARLPSLNQYREVAEYISKNKKLSAEEIKLEVKTRFPQNAIRNNIITTLDDETKKIIENVKESLTN